MYLVEGHYYNENSFLMIYTEEEIEWIRNGGDIPASIREAANLGYDIDIDYLETLDNNKIYSESEKQAYRIGLTTDYSYLGNYKTCGSLKKYTWSEFTDVSLS